MNQCAHHYKEFEDEYGKQYRDKRDMPIRYTTGIQRGLRKTIQRVNTLFICVQCGSETWLPISGIAKFNHSDNGKLK